MLHADARACGFLHIGRPDAALRRSDPLSFHFAPSRLEDGVDLLVVIEENMRAGGDGHSRDDLDARLLQSGDFLEERGQMDDHSRTENDRFAFVEASGGQEVEDALHALNDDRMAGIGSAACARNDSEMLCQEIDDLPLPFVPPLRAYDGASLSE